jgi:hypothetical protein
LEIPDGKDFSEKVANNNGIQSRSRSGPNGITNDMCRQVINNIKVHVEEVATRNGGHINIRFTEDKSPCSGLSFCMSISSILIEIKILLIDQLLDHFVRHPV